jgi:hypothetical protein
MALLDKAIQQARVGAPMNLTLDGPLSRAMTSGGDY